MTDIKPRQIITVNNIKGGVGKTTITVNLAYTLAKKFNKKVLLIDVDPQMNATSFFFDDEGIENLLSDQSKTIAKILNPFSKLNDILKESDNIIHTYKSCPNLHIIPSQFGFKIGTSEEDKLRIKRFLNSEVVKEKNFEFVFIDTPPTLSVYSKIAFIASDGYIVPTTCSKLSLVGLSTLKANIQDLDDFYGGNMNIQMYGIIMTKVPSATRSIKYTQTLSALQTKYPDDVFQSHIREENAADSMTFKDKPEERFFINNSDKSGLKSKEALHLNEDIMKVTEEFIDRIGKRIL